MVRALVRCESVGVVGRQCEAAATVLEDEAGVFGYDSGAEAAEEGVDEAAAVAVFVGDGEVDGVAGLEGGRAVLEGCVGFGGVEEGGAGCEVFLVG